MERIQEVSELLRVFRNDSEWIVGWNRKKENIGHLDAQRFETMAKECWKGFEDIAILKLENSVVLNWPQPPLSPLHKIKRGQNLLLVGSPYGLLSPSIFYNCTYNTTVSNIVSDKPESNPGMSITIFNK